MDDLVAFLRERIAEDEAMARAATDGPWATWEGASMHGLGDLLHPVLTPGQKPGSHAVIVTASWLDAEHVSRHDPARTLREVEARRRLLNLHSPTKAGGDECAVCDYGVDSCGCMGMNGGWPCATIALLALPYADHPDYREEWRP